MAELSRYYYRLLRYVPRAEAGELYNVAVLCYDERGRVVDARFTPDFDRMRCNPAADLEFLGRLRGEFEDALILGEGFTEYATELTDPERNDFDATEPKVFGTTDLSSWIVDFTARKLATQPPLEDGRAERSRGVGRSAVRHRMSETFAQHGLFLNGHGMQRDVHVKYGEPVDEFVFDFGYASQTKEQHFLQAMGLRGAKTEARSLILVLQECGGVGELTVVADDALGDDVRNMLSVRGVGAVNLSAIDTYAGTIREKMGLGPR